MKSLKFKKIDAFTGEGSSGNPAGYILMDPDDLLSAEEMQTIAAELKGFVNEVGFVHRDSDRIYLKYFSSECEVAFCGHATIAIMYDLLKNSPDLAACREVVIQVNAGPLLVFNDIQNSDAVYISAPQPKFIPCRLAAGQVADALGLDQTNLNTGLPIRIIDGGLRTLIVPLNSLQSCIDIFPDENKLKQFSLENDIDIVHVFVQETKLKDALYRTRVFAPRFGYLEDPATGSGNAAFGYYLLDEGKWEGDFKIEQGPSRNNPNIVAIRLMEDNGIKSILFGGSAITRIEGQYYLHGIHA
jgi:PhzF family phenazine biosynthesis protein